MLPCFREVIFFLQGGIDTLRVFIQANPVIHASDKQNVFFKNMHIAENIPLDCLSVGSCGGRQLMNIQWYISEFQLSMWGEGDMVYVNLLCCSCSCSLPRKSRILVQFLLVLTQILCYYTLFIRHTVRSRWSHMHCYLMIIFLHYDVM